MTCKIHKTQEIIEAKVGVTQTRNITGIGVSRVLQLLIIISTQHRGRQVV